MATPEKRQYAAHPAELPRGTLVDLLFGAVEEHGNGAAFLYRAGVGDWRPVSHEDFLRRVRRLALGLEALGLGRGDRAAILSENRLEWVLADYACLCAGIIDVAIHATLPAGQIDYLLENSGSRLIFVSTEEQRAKIDEIRSKVPALEQVVVFDEDAATTGSQSLRSLLERGEAEERAGKGAGFRERALQADPDDVATILYTSGTTGQPKGVMLTHNNIYSNTRATADVLPMGSDDTALSFLPLSHIFERMADYRYMAEGGTIAHVPSFELVGPALREVRPTIAAATPRVYEKVYDAMMSVKGWQKRVVLWARDVAQRYADQRLMGRRPGPALRLQHGLADRLVYRKLRERMGGRIRHFVSGGAPLSAHLMRFFYGAGVPILEGYGLTETSPVTNVNPPDAPRPGTVGPPVPGTEVMIADDGEVLIRGPQVMKGYYEMPEATAAAIDGEGWFGTGDVGEIDADGYLRITDRKKDLILTAGGKNIAPQPIEAKLKESPLVEEAVIVGDRRPYTVLLVVPSFEALADWAVGAGVTDRSPEALVADARVQSRMEEEIFGLLEPFARYEQPKKVALLVKEFTVEGGELTPTLKVKRRVVEKSRASVIEMLYEREGRVFDGARVMTSAAAEEGEP